MGDVETGGVNVQASVNGRRLTLDPIEVFPVTVKIREVESTIPCGFQVAWASGDVDGEELEFFAGAGFGSEWATIRYKGRRFCFPMSEVIASFVVALEEKEAKDA